MKKQKNNLTLIRPGCFETNSSSNHAFTLAAVELGELLDTLEPNEDGLLTIHGGTFGRSWHRYNDAYSKASYIATQGMYDELLHPILIAVLKQQTKAYRVAIELDHTYNYIDHESIGRCPHDHEEMRRFIFDKNSWLLLQDSDYLVSTMFNDFPVFKQSGEIDLPVYPYEVSIEGFEEKEHLKVGYTEEELLKAIYKIEGNQGFNLEGNLINLYSQKFSSWADIYELKPWKKEIDIPGRTLYFVRDTRYQVELLFGLKHLEGLTKEQATQRYIDAEAWEKARYDENDPAYVKEVKFNVKLLETAYAPTLDELPYYRNNQDN